MRGGGGLWYTCPGRQHAPECAKATMRIVVHAEHGRLLLRVGRRAVALHAVAPCVFVLAGTWLHGGVVVAGRCRTVSRYARAGRGGWRGREGGGKPALGKIP